MKTIKQHIIKEGNRVCIKTADSGMGYWVMTQQHKSIISPYCPEWEIMEDGWRPCVEEFARTLEDAEEKYIRQIAMARR